VDGSVSPEKIAGSLAWGKFSNCGQTCVAPDYVLTTPDLAQPLAEAVARAAEHAYGEDPRTARDYGRIVNERHTRRLAGLLDSGTAVVGGTADIAERYVAPTVLVDVDPDAPVMQEEIFGPILPIVTVADHHEAIDFISARPEPLALYAYTQRAQVREDLIAGTSSGSVGFNTVMTQLGVPALPFGGVGASGTGRYHGEFSIATFSHERAVLRKTRGLDTAAMARPPYSDRMRRMLLKN
jgi:aldehyde dehydrogenase (NAD+)